LTEIKFKNLLIIEPKMRTFRQARFFLGPNLLPAVPRLRNFCSNETKPKNPSVNQEEISKFNQVPDWWDTEGSQAGLHGYNNLRIDFLRKNLLKTQPPTNSYHFLNNLNTMDIGCGAGLLTEVHFSKNPN
jgi:hypothetical protein